METLQTPRLCIDGRVASELRATGLVAQETIDQLVSGRGEGEASSEWIEKHRTVLLAHPKQIFSGQLRRFDTNRRTGTNVITWVWEKNFVKSSALSLFHRFRPIDRAKPTLPCPTLTTLLPARHGLPFFLSRRPNQKYIVPSHKDATLLRTHYGMEKDQVLVHKPAVRRFVHFVQKEASIAKGTALFLVADRKGKEKFKKLKRVVSARYPNLNMNVVFLKDRTDVTPMAWMKLLESTKICFYLTSQNFDWATLALEAFYWNVPVLFPDEHPALNELLPHSPLRLSQFLVDMPELVELKLKAQSAYLQLDAEGVFDPFLFAKQYKTAYENVLPSEA